MPRCAACNTVILWGSVSDDRGRKFCNQTCLSNGMAARVQQELPAEIVEHELIKLHQGPCPICQGPGPVDVCRSHFAQSFLIVTRWGSKPIVSCRKCGRKAQLQSLLTTTVMGWWGFPWGLLVTPVQIARNIGGLTSGGPNPLKPSKELEHIVRAGVGQYVYTGKGDRSSD